MSTPNAPNPATVATIAANPNGSAASRILNNLEDPQEYAGLVGNLLGTLAAFGVNASPIGVAVSGLAYALLQLFHPEPHLVPVPANLGLQGPAVTGSPVQGVAPSPPPPPPPPPPQAPPMMGQAPQIGTAA